MKKLLGIVVLGLLWTNIFLATNLYSHPSDQFAFLECPNSEGIVPNVEINLKKKIITFFMPSTPTRDKVVFHIHEIEPHMIKAIREDNKTKRLVIHRFLTYLWIQNKTPNGNWEDKYGPIKCSAVKRQF